MSKELTQGATTTRDPIEFPEQASLRRYWVGFLAFLAVVVTFLDRVNLSVAAPVLRKQLHLSPALMGVALSAFFWSYTVLQIPVGRLIDRWGVKRTWTSMFMFWGLVTAATGFVNNLAGLSVVRGVLGVVEAPTYPGLVPILHKWFRKVERGLVMGGIGMGLSIGLTGGSLLSGVLLVHLGWRGLFVVTGIISALIGVLWWGTYREHTTGSPASTSPATSSSVQLTSLLRQRNVWGLTLGYFGSGYTLYLFLTWLPSYFVRDFHFSIIKSAAFSGLVFLLGIVGKPLTGSISSLLFARGLSLTAARKWVLVPVTLIATVVALAAFTRNPVVAVVTLAIAETFATAGGSLCFATAGDIAPEGAGGQIGGILNTANALGGVIAPIVTGVMLGATHSFVGPILIAAVVLGISALAYGLILQRVEPLQIR